MADNMNLGLILVVFVGVIIGTALMPAVGIFTGTAINTVSVTNASFTAPAAGATSDITGQELLNTPIVVNGSGSEIINTGNYTIDEGVSVTTGLKTVRITMTNPSTYAGRPINITYDYGADGYIDNAGGRALVPLILIFMALSIALLALSPVLQDKLFELVGKMK